MGEEWPRHEFPAGRQVRNLRPNRHRAQRAGHGQRPLWAVQWGCSGGLLAALEGRGTADKQLVAVNPASTARLGPRPRPSCQKMVNDRWKTVGTAPQLEDRPRDKPQTDVIGEGTVRVGSRRRGRQGRALAAPRSPEPPLARSPGVTRRRDGSATVCKAPSQPCSPRQPRDEGQTHVLRSQRAGGRVAQRGRGICPSAVACQRAGDGGGQG
ncbi:fibrinogen C domain containing 1 [Phyllostomus discolor]|uniref:Fibrinogen C domain containing 1 n=1 Tax=Phyllostomus discolor TaxID=89673 RepID=A0A834B6M1_9CHIR|nr:fibrinogen C domain containing 1 [Phyllostomus discolor]